MKTANKILMAFIALGFLIACEQEVVMPELKVNAVVEKTTVISEDGLEEKDAYKVTFTFDGEADNVVFYSGEPGSDYRYSDRYSRIVTPHLEFTSALAGGGVPNTLRVLVSNDFEPEYEYLSGAPTTVVYPTWAVENETWTDITDRFTIPGNRLLGDPHQSGEAVISEFHADLPLFVAFQFKADLSDGSAAPGLWSFSKFNIRNVYEDGTSAMYIEDGITTDWKSVDLGDPVQCSKSIGQISLNPAGASQINTMLISTPYYPSHVVTDKGLVIKSPDKNLREYTHTYVAPQTESLTAAFVATNSLYGKVVQTVREIEVIFGNKTE